MVASPVNISDGSKVWSLVVSYTPGSTGNEMSHTYHDEFEHSVMGLGQSAAGNCSAPMMIWPSPSTSVHWYQSLIAR